MPRFGLKNNKLTIKDHFVKNDKNMQYKKKCPDFLQVVLFFLYFVDSLHFSFSLIPLLWMSGKNKWRSLKSS